MLESRGVIPPVASTSAAATTTTHYLDDGSERKSVASADAHVQQLFAPTVDLNVPNPKQNTGTCAVCCAVDCAWHITRLCVLVVKYNFLGRSEYTSNGTSILVMITFKEY